MSKILLIAVFLLLPLLCGCETIEEAFSGLEGRVALGPVEGAEVKIFDASEFVSFASSAGMVATTTTNAYGDFRLAIPDRYIGRSLICAANFPADNPLTAQDERAHMIASDDSIVMLEPMDGPWVAVLDYFEGLTVNVAITPITTMAWEALRSGDDAVLGAGNNRFVDQHIRLTNMSVANCFGLQSDPTRTFPAHNVSGANSQPASPTLIDDNAGSRALRYALDQLELSANAFAQSTTNANDRPADFLKALFRDARDGRLDGASFGTQEALLASAGAPDLAGVDAAGVPKLLNFLLASSQSDQSAEIDALRLRQSKSLGALFQPLIASVSRTRLAHNSIDEVVISGSGFSPDMEIVFGSDELSLFTPLRDTFVVSGDQTNRGAILEVRENQMRIRMPDFPTIAPAYRPSAGNPSASFNLFLRKRFVAGSNDGKYFLDRLIATFEVVYVDGLTLLESRIVREEVAGDRKADLMIGTIGTDPSTLDPSIDDVYALEVRVANGLSVAMNDVTLNLANCQATVPLVTTVEVGDLAGPNDLVFDPQAILDAAGISLAAQSTTSLRFRFGRHVNAPSLLAGHVVTLQPAIRGTRSDTLAAIQAASNSKSAAVFRLGSSALTPAPVTNLAPLNQSLANDENVDIEWQIDLAARASANGRALRFTRLSLSLEIGGEILFAEAFVSLDESWSAEIAGLSLTNLRLTPVASNNQMLGTATSQGPLALRFNLANLSAAAGVGNLDISLEWSELESGVSGMLSESIQVDFN